MATDLIEVTRKTRLHYKNSPDSPIALFVDLFPGVVNRVAEEVVDACFAHAEATKGAAEENVIEALARFGQFKLLRSSEAQAKADGIAPFEEPVRPPLQAAAEVYAQASKTDGRLDPDKEAKAQDLAMTAAERAKQRIEALK